MARVMFVLGTHEPTREMLQTIELATAARRAGSDVVLYLHADGVYLTNPDKFVRMKVPFQGFDSPLAMVQDAIAAGVQFWFATRPLQQLGLEVPPGAHAVSAEQLALAWSDFDHVITL